MPMTIGALIEELQRWPADGLVDVALDHTGPGSGHPAQIVGVAGYAGGRLDGKDSGVSLIIATAPTWTPAGA